jgi:hypothetical protein
LGASRQVDAEQSHYRSVRDPLRTLVSKNSRLRKPSSTHRQDWIAFIVARIMVRQLKPFVQFGARILPCANPLSTIEREGDQCPRLPESGHDKNQQICLVPGLSDQVTEEDYER